MDICDSVINGFYFLYSTVPNNCIGYELFETLNQRGEKLLTIDLFKNLLFEKFERQIETENIELFWNKLVNLFEDESNMKQFLRHFWLANYSFVREKKLFTAIKEKIDSESPSIETFEHYTNNIFNQASIYSQLINPEEKYWNNKEIFHTLKELNYLNFSQQLPLFLAAYIDTRDPDKRQFTKLIKTYLNLAVKKYSILGSNPNELEEEYSDWARKIINEDIKIIEVINKLIEYTPSYDEINDTLRRGIQLKPKSAKYILIKINNALSSELTQNLLWENNPTLEHIIPKNPDNSWLNLLNRQGIIDFNNLLNRLGNLTILGSRENKELGNISFKDKLKTYIDTNLQINLKSFPDGDEFDLEYIKKREEILISIIKEKKIWFDV